MSAAFFFHCRRSLSFVGRLKSNYVRALDRINKSLFRKRQVRGLGRYFFVFVIISCKHLEGSRRKLGKKAKMGEGQEHLLHGLKYEGTQEQLREVDDHVSKRYDIDKRLGRGAYGIVWKARSKRSGRLVAIKKIFDAFRNQTDAQRTFREIVFLKAFRDHPNIVQLLNVHRADNNRDLYLVFEYMNTDLQRAIHRRPGILKNVHKRFIMYQLLSATRYLHAGTDIFQKLS